MAEKKPFDPDEFLAKTKPFDPDEFLRKAAPAEPRHEGHFARPRQPVPDTPMVQDPTEQMFVSREAATDPRSFGEKAGTAATYYGEMVPMAADSATYGLGNRGVAYTRSLLDQSGGANYDKHIAEQNAYLKRLRDADPDRAVMSELLGGVAGGSALAKGGITLAKPGVGWINRAIRGGAEGALQGGAQSVGQSYGDVGEKAVAGAKGLAMGGTFGVGVPLAGSAGAGAKTAYDMFKGQVPRYGSPSVLRAVDADRAFLEALPSKGPDAMLVDAPSMRRVAAGAQTTPGPGATRMEEALVAREGQTPPRLREGTTETLGPNVRTTQVEDELAYARKAVGPEWEEAFKKAKAVDTDKIALWLEGELGTVKGEAAAALAEVRKNLNIRGTDVLDPHPRALHETRQALDGILYQKQPAGAAINEKVERALTRARDKITEELHDKVPGMANLDARTSELKSRLDAYKRGKEILDTGREKWIQPDEWIDEKAAMALPKGGPRATNQPPSEAPQFSEFGTRNEVGRLLELGSDELRKLENTFGPYKQATEHLKTQFGVDNVEKFRQMLTTNREFRDSYTAILKGSQTANKVEAAADIERPYGAFARYFLHPKQMATEALDRAEAGFGASMRNRITEMLATRQGGIDPGTGLTMDALRKELLDAAEAQARNDISRAMVERAARTGTTAVMPHAFKP